MTARMSRILSLLAILALLAVLAGCGGGGSTSSIGGWVIDDQLFTPNYVTSLDGQLYHWAELPMTVSFDLPANWAVFYNGRQFDATNEWNGEGVQMAQVVAWGVNSDATVTFSDQLGGMTLGKTEFMYNPVTGRMATAAVTIALKDSHGVAQTPDEIQAVIAHELGHALGIGGHSPYSTDLMYPTLQNPPQAAGLRDLNTMKTAYPSWFGIPMVMQEQTRGPEQLVTKVIE